MHHRSAEGVARRSVVAAVAAIMVAVGVVEVVVEALAVMPRMHRLRVAGALLLPGLTPRLVLSGMSFPSPSLC